MTIPALRRNAQYSHLEFMEPDNTRRSLVERRESNRNTCCVQIGMFIMHDDDDDDDDVLPWQKIRYYDIDQLDNSLEKKLLGIIPIYVQEIGHIDQILCKLNGGCTSNEFHDNIVQFVIKGSSESHSLNVRSTTGNGAKQDKFKIIFDCAPALIINYKDLLHNDPTGKLKKRCKDWMEMLDECFTKDKNEQYTEWRKSGFATTKMVRRKKLGHKKPFRIMEYGSCVDICKDLKSIIKLHTMLVIFKWWRDTIHSEDSWRYCMPWMSPN